MYVKLRICGWSLFLIGVVVFFVGGGLQERTPLSIAGLGVTLLGMIITSVANLFRVYNQYRKITKRPGDDGRPIP